MATRIMHRRRTRFWPRTGSGPGTGTPNECGGHPPPGASGGSGAFGRVVQNSQSPGQILWGDFWSYEPSMRNTVRWSEGDQTCPMWSRGTSVPVHRTRRRWR